MSQPITLTLLGTGSAFNFDKGNVSALLEGPGFCALIDCGMTVPAKLKELGKLEAVTHIFITHTHADHVGGLELLAQWRYWVSVQSNVFQKKPVVPVPKLVVTRDILERLRHIEKIGLAEIQDAGGRALTATLETYFDVEILDDSGREYPLPSMDEPAHAYIKAMRVDHVPGDFPAYGFVIRALPAKPGDPGFKVLWSGDTRLPLTDEVFWHKPDLIFHDAQLFRGPANGAGDVHAFIGDVTRSFAKMKKETGFDMTGRTWLLHYGGNYQDVVAQTEIEAFGMAGFAEPGQSFTLRP